MLAFRRHKLVRFLAVALLVWLGVDSLSRGACAHDRVTFTRTHTEVGGAPSQERPADRDGVNHCSCHWQYLPAMSPQCVVSNLVQPLTRPVRQSTPQFTPRLLDRPPQAA